MTERLNSKEIIRDAIDTELSEIRFNRKLIETTMAKRPTGFKAKLTAWLEKEIVIPLPAVAAAAAVVFMIGTFGFYSLFQVPVLPESESRYFFPQPVITSEGVIYQMQAYVVKEN